MHNRQGEPSLFERLVHGVKWNMLDVAAVSAGNLAVAILCARLLGVDDFGALAIIKSTVYMLATVAGLGLGGTATKYIAELKGAAPLRLERVLGLCQVVAGVVSGLFAAALLALAPEIAAGQLQAPQLAPHLRLAAVYVFFTTLNGYQVGAMIGFEAFRSMAVLNVLQTVLSLAGTALLTWWWGLWGAACALGLTACCNWLLYHGALQRELQGRGLRLRYRQLRREAPVLTGFAVPAAVSGVIGSLAVWAANALLVRQEDGLVAMALFSAAGNVRSLVLFFPALVTRVISPMLCTLAGGGRGGACARLFGFNFAATVGVAAVVAVAASVAAPYLLAVFGRGFRGGEAVVLVVALFSVVEVAANSLYQTLFIHGRLWWQVGVISAWSAVLLGVVQGLAADFGAVGLGCAYLAAHLVSCSCYLAATVRLKAWKREEDGRRAAAPD